jgi:mannan endo-1,4-beta-mannosidase
MMRPTGPRVFGVLVALALVGYTFVLAPRLVLSSGTGTAAGPLFPTPDGGTSASDAPTYFPADDKTFIGVTTTEGAFNLKPVDAFAAAGKRRPAVLEFSQGWAAGGFDRAQFDTIARAGMLPMLSWEPWNYKDDNVRKDGTHVDQPKYRLDRITAGAFDDYLRKYAQGVKSLGYHVAIRFAHEMNGVWYPWAATVNGNQPGDYPAMWRHVHDVFTSVGATNVIWVWSPNITFDPKSRLSQLYPGDDYTDWIGLSGYYGTGGERTYRSPGGVFDNTLRELAGFTHKPIVLTETGATDVVGLKAQWIADLGRYLPKHPEIIGFIWYEAVRETDWRIAGSQAASAAFADLASDPRYDVTWRGTMLPRTTVDLPSPSPSKPSPTPSKARPKPTRSHTPSPSPSVSPSA